MVDFHKALAAEPREQHVADGPRRLAAAVAMLPCPAFPGWFVAFDTETTGLDRNRDYVCTVGLATVERGEIKSVVEYALNWPAWFEARGDQAGLRDFLDRLAAVEQAMQKAGKEFFHSEASLRAGVDPAHGLLETMRALQGAVAGGGATVAHNAGFDVPMLLRAFQVALDVDYPWDDESTYDTQPAERTLMGGCRSADYVDTWGRWLSTASNDRTRGVKLDVDLVPRYGLDADCICDAHTAACDAEMTARLTLRQLAIAQAAAKAAAKAAAEAAS